MGSFNVKCMATGIDIHGDEPCYLILMLPYYFPRTKLVTITPNGDYCLQADTFVPMGVPIEGLYSGYGDLESIIENTITKAYEAFFGLSINDFIKCITDNRNLQSTDFSNMQPTFRGNRYKDNNIPDHGSLIYGMNAREVFLRVQEDFKLDVEDKKSLISNIFHGFVHKKAYNTLAEHAIQSTEKGHLSPSYSEMWTKLVNLVNDESDENWASGADFFNTANYCKWIFMDLIAKRNHCLKNAYIRSLWFRKAMRMSQRTFIPNIKYLPDCQQSYLETVLTVTRELLDKRTHRYSE